ncbi:MAG: branched-chain amino acid ABC transporter substrate-binding protein [Aquabacterium sp.]|uniref:branched-chain amino acid ABC transporter substrate-binding protein n=1 Tax=Aquabacterium sp. TaxID=1872578 RepID=UPI0025BC112E|nr:branched-chain amino acid ABC transporter substrate-binding protein [Aquabacterium sp.]MBI5926692.1 branched-chain amino acid ABC transporter substrate-binding protein [Aquabacterium sp.]
MSVQARLALAAAVSATLMAPAAQAQTVVKIGHVGPVSGAQAHYGRDNENGARMAVAELNAQKLSIGGKKVTFELVAEDDAADPKQGTAAAQKLCDAKVNGVVGHLNSGTTIPASKVYNQCGLPMVTPSATNPELTTLGYKNVYRLLANDLALGAGLANYAADTLKLKKVAIIDDRTAYGKGVSEVFAKVAKERGIEVVSQQYTNDKAVDFSAILTSIKSKKPDGIFFGGMDPQAGPMLRQMQQLGLNKAYLFGGDGICTDKLMELSSGAKTLANVVCAVGGASLDKLPNGQAWRARYETQFPKQFQVYSPYTYDATMVLVDAMKRANSVDPKVYGPKLAETNYQGVTAKVMFEPNGELKNPAMTLYSYKEGKKLPLN